MLVISRKEDEVITLTDNNSGAVTTIKISEIGSKRVRLAIDAPDSIDIERDDMRHRIREGAKAS